MSDVRKLALSPDLSVPIDFVTRRVAALGMSGAGKSNAFAVMIEQTHKCGGVFVAFDPLGTLWGLRAAADGDGPGLPVPIFGGHHADVEISSTRGALLARELFEANASALIDLSAFEGDERCTFVSDFCREKMKLHARRKKPLAFFVDEVHLLAPETPQSKAENRCEIALADIHTGGRGVGIGLKTATQSAAEQSKRTLKQAELVIALRTFSPLDQKQIKAYLGSATTTDRAKEVLQSLARLRDGEAWFISPHWLAMIESHRFAMRETFDSSRTPEVGETIAEPKQFAAVDLERLRDAMAADDDVDGELESADVSPDVAKLRARIAELEARAGMVERVVERVEVPVIPESLMAALRDTMDRFEYVAATIRGDFQTIESAVAQVTRAEIPPVAKTQNRTVRAERVAPAPSAAVALPALPRSSSSPALGGGPLKILEALAGARDGRATRTQLGFLSGYAAGGGSFGRYMSTLRSEGLVTGDGSTIVITDAGRAIAGTPSAVTTADVHAMWRSKLKAGSLKMFDALVSVWPKGMTRDQLGDATGYEAAGGSFGRYLSTLSGQDIIERRGGVIVISDALFPTGALR